LEKERMDSLSTVYSLISPNPTPSSKHSNYFFNEERFQSSTSSLSFQSKKSKKKRTNKRKRRRGRSSSSSSESDEIESKEDEEKKKKEFEGYEMVKKYQKLTHEDEYNAIQEMMKGRESDEEIVYLILKKLNEHVRSMRSKTTTTSNSENENFNHIIKEE